MRDHDAVRAGGAGHRGRPGLGAVGALKVVVVGVVHALILLPPADTPVIKSGFRHETPYESPLDHRGGGR
jgi:hypothetical protein